MRNPWTVAATALREEAVEIVYPDTGERAVMVLRELTIPQATAAGTKGDEYAAMFSGVDEQGNQRFYVPPIEGAEPVALNETFCQSAANIEAMQVQEEKFSFGDLVGMSLRMKEQYIRLSNIAAQVQVGGNALRPPAAGAAPSSAPPSTITNPTPPSPGMSAGASGVSTNGSEGSGAPLEPMRRGKRSHAPATST